MDSWINQLSLAAFLVHKLWYQQRETHSWNRHSFLPHLNSTPNLPPCSWDEERANGKEGSGVKVIWQGAERQQSWQHSKWSPACIHCKIKFPLFSQSQRPWKHLWLSRRPEPASSSSAAQGTTSQPPRSTQPARGTKLKRGMERDDQCLQKKNKAARICIPLTLYPEESWEAGRTSLHLARNYTLQNLQASCISMSCSQNVPAGRWDEMSEAAGLTLHWEERKAGKHNSNPALSSSSSLHNQLVTLREVCGTPVSGSVVLRVPC